MQDKGRDELSLVENLLRVKNAMKNQIPVWGVVAVMATVVILVFVIFFAKDRNQDKPQVISQPVLEKIVNISELSTYEVVYNGVAVVYNENKAEKIDFYVSYESVVKAGLDLEKISVEVDHNENVVYVTLPQIEITDISVDFKSLDYIFMNDKMNTSGVSEVAYKACEADVSTEAAEQTAIIELAKQNAENIINALVNPFINQMDSSYSVDVVWEEVR